MSDLTEERQKRWQQIVAQLQREYGSLPQSEKSWIAELLAQISQLQRTLDQLFHKAGGELICTDCQGACCAKGHNHAGLPNLLVYLQQELVPPPADFSVTCPWLGEQGCVHEAGQRPYNCITFLCDKLEKHLDAADVEAFYRLDRELRGRYQAFAERYAAGGMSGLLLQAERLQGSPLLAVKAGHDDNRD